MCWQCGSKPHEWLNIFESFAPRCWYFGGATGDGVFEFELENAIYHTNPFVDRVEWMSGHVPGEVDQDGTPWFLEGAYQGAYETRRHTFAGSAAQAGSTSGE